MGDAADGAPEVAGTFCEPEPQPDPPRPPATAPLAECAAAHDGQSADAWLTMLYRMYGWLD